MKRRWRSLAKSYSYRKIIDIPPADSDDDPDPIDADVRDHGFKEPEDEEDSSALEEGQWMSIPTRYRARG